MAPPELTVDFGPTIVFTDNEDWRSSITGITYFSISPDGTEGISVETTSYNESEGQIYVPEPDPWVEQEVDFDNLPEGWDSEGFPIYFFVVYADGYEDALAFWLED